MAEPAMATSGEAVPDVGAEVETVLARFNGDARAALAAALDDVAFASGDRLRAAGDELWLRARMAAGTRAAKNILGTLGSEGQFVAAARVALIEWRK